MDWSTLTSIALNAVFATGFIVTITTLHSERRKRSAEAGISESDLRRAELEIDKLESEADAEHMRAVIRELRQARKLLHDVNAQLTLILEEKFEWMHRATVAEKARCECWECLNRVPPLVVKTKK